MNNVVGDAVLDHVSTDFAGTRRPVGAGYDIGAYEAGDGSNPLAPQNLAVMMTC